MKNSSRPPLVGISSSHPGHTLPVTMQALEGVVSAGDSGLLGPVAFIALYAAATVLLFPASVLTLAAGAMFGPVKGTAIVSLASTLGAALAFLTSR